VLELVRNGDIFSVIIVVCSLQVIPQFFTQYCDKSNNDYFCVARETKQNSAINKAAGVIKVN
jgi:hypothetical protein